MANIQICKTTCRRWKISGITPTHEYHTTVRTRRLISAINVVFRESSIAHIKAFFCPNCGNHEEAFMSVTRRVCGYLGSPNSRPFNHGKQEEVRRRVKHLESAS